MTAQAKREYGRLRALLRCYRRAILSPVISRACLLSSAWTGKRRAMVARELVLADGSWAVVKSQLRKRFGSDPWVSAFIKWADKENSKEVRV